MSLHFLKVCKICRYVIAQCRCPGLKTVQTEICEKCLKETNLPLFEIELPPEENNLPNE